MKTTKKTFLPIMLLLCFLFSSIIRAQTDKNELRIQRLKENVARYETKVASKERKLEIADSLITTGEDMIYKAEDAFVLVENQQTNLDKEYRRHYKQLAKLQKSKDEEVADKAEADLKALYTQYKSDTKAIDAKIKNLTKQATAGQNNIAKGKEMRKTAGKDLKEAQARLDVAVEKYEAAIGTGS